MRKGDIAIGMIVVIFLSIISIVLLLSLFGAKLPAVGKSIYCMTFFHIQSSVFIPKSARVDESFCKEQSTLGQHIILPEREHLRDFMDGFQTQRIKSSPGLTNFSIPNATIINATLYVKSDKNIVSLLIEFPPGNITIPFSSIESKAPIQLNFTFHLINLINNCRFDPCDINISMLFDNGATLTLYGLDIEYEKCFVKEKVIASALSCWEKAKYGEYNKDLLCDELTLSPSCSREQVIAENIITKYLIENNLCETLPNNDIDCTSGQKRLYWTNLDLKNIKNILVEYDSTNKAIKVS